ncbi:MAG: phosphoribosylaminoimidazolesuccinocarboxamide synthase [Dehalococcoidia bacterium]|nr:phosphoribosylaminoimidazolesuccinocarboxamide synthase [Dehalococcoidia bacterium]
MKTIYNGKTKTVLTDEATGDYYLLFKDDATGENGVFDPGSNYVGGSVAGKGKTGLIISQYFFKLMERYGISTHYLGADIEHNLMKVRNVFVPKLEFILRYFTAGSMCRRFSLAQGIPFAPPYLEVTMKDDANGDPLISERLCILKGLLKEKEYDRILNLLVKVGDILKAELNSLGLTLIDFKLEFGFDEERNIYISDEITPDIWRVKDKDGNIPNQIDCANLIMAKISSN